MNHDTIEDHRAGNNCSSTTYALTIENRLEVRVHDQTKILPPSKPILNLLRAIISIVMAESIEYYFIHSSVMSCYSLIYLILCVAYILK